MDRDKLTGTVDTVASRTGLTSDAVAILAIVAGVLILVFPNILQFVLGILLIVVGIVFLVDRRRKASASTPPRV